MGPIWLLPRIGPGGAGDADGWCWRAEAESGADAGDGHRTALATQGHGILCVDLVALHEFDASAHDDASLQVPSEARVVPLDRQFGRVRGWQWRQADETRYRFLLLEVTMPMYGGRREYSPPMRPQRQSDH